MAKIGFALGGGGSRGFAHLGAIKALEEYGIKPDMICSVSAGSIAGTFIAAGFSPDETYDILKEDSIFQYSKLKFPIKGMLSLDGLEQKMNKIIPYKNIEDLPLKLMIGATNLGEGVLTCFENGPIGLLVKASASIPVIFEPVDYNKQQYCDGGVITNVPIEALIGKCDKIIAINISPAGKSKKLQTMLSIGYRTFMLAMKAKVSALEDQCDLFIEPPALHHFGIFDTAKTDKLYQIGYEYTIQLLKKSKFKV